MSSASNPTPLMRLSRYAAIGFLILVFAFLANWLGSWLIEIVQLEITGLNKNYIYSAIFFAMVFYAILLAIPFVPGVEIGFGLILMFGVDLVIPVYFSTVAGINLSFLIGRIMPVTRIQALLRFLFLERAANALTRLSTLPQHKKAHLLVESSPKRFTPFLLKHRYLAIAAALNIPGNAIIGGGGGIGLLAGISRLFPWPLFALTVALAVAPIPIVILVFGLGAFG